MGRDVRFVPKADSCTAAILSLFDHLVGGNEQCGRHSQSESRGCILVDLKLVFDRLLDGQITRISAFEDTISVRCGAPRFYWTSISPHIQSAISYLSVTSSGRSWIANLYSNVFCAEREINLYGPQR